MIIREVQKPVFSDILGVVRIKTTPNKRVSLDNILKRVYFTGSGKGSIAIVLQYLRHKGILTNKLSEVIVADWLGFWVYNQIQAFSFPAKKYSERTKAILVYHQYGFPQDMDKILDFAHEKKLVVIEDCAHALASSYKGKILGSMGDFCIYSFSKWCFCYALGGVSSKFDDFKDFYSKMIAQSPFGAGALKDIIKLFSEYDALSHNNPLKRHINLALAMSYSLYGDALKPGKTAIKLALNKLEFEINERIRRYLYFREKTSNLGICDHLESDGVTPYIIPILCKEKDRMKIVNILKDKNIETGIYNFDINRNLLAPKFEECVWIPCHTGISEENFEMITDALLKNLG